LIEVVAGMSSMWNFEISKAKHLLRKSTGLGIDLPPGAPRLYLLNSLREIAIASMDSVRSSSVARTNKALRDLHQGLSTLQWSTLEETGEVRYWMAHAHHLASYSSADLGQRIESIAHLKAAIPLYEEAKECIDQRREQYPNQAIQIAVDLAAAYQDLADLEGGAPARDLLRDLQDVLKLVNEPSVTRDRAGALYVQLAAVNLRYERPDEAYGYILDAKRLFDPKDNIVGYAVMTIVEGQIYLHWGIAQRDHAALEKSLELVTKARNVLKEAALAGRSSKGVQVYLAECEQLIPRIEEQLLRSGTATEPALRNPSHASPPAKGASRKFIETAGMRRASHAKTKKTPPTISTT
jgi:tetratricopeptide (TPR) repeat protein